MTEGGTFLDAIRDAPDDDTVRLVYADWLEERGDNPARAALIRRSLGLGDPLTRVDPAELYPHLHGVLLDADAWQRRINLRPQAEVWFSRGFIFAVRCEWRWWERHGDALTARERVRLVRLTTYPGGRLGFMWVGRGVMPIAGRDVSFTDEEFWDRNRRPGRISYLALRRRWPQVTEWEFAECPPGDPVPLQIRAGTPVAVDDDGRVVPAGPGMYSVGVAEKDTDARGIVRVAVNGPGRPRPIEVEAGHQVFPDAEDF